MKLKNNNLILLVGMLVFIVLFALILAKPAPYSIDEAEYLLAVDGLSNSGYLQTLNGYAKFRSSELNIFRGVVRNNRLITKYPPLYFYIALPFYAIGGAFGLVCLNVLAAIGVIWVFFRIVKDITGRESIALEALVVLMFATFFLEYALAIWPHMLSLFLSLSSIYLFRTGLARSDSVRAYIFYAGLMLGIAIGVRLAEVMLTGVFVGSLLLQKKDFLSRISIFFLGLMLPLGLVSFLNHQRFGSINPLTYSGDNPNVKFPTVSWTAIAGMIALVALFILLYRLVSKRHDGGDSQNYLLFFRKNRSAAIVLSAFLLVFLVFLSLKTDFVENIYQYCRNFMGYVVNIIFLNRSPYEAAEYIGTGFLSYGGTIKKSLLQSSPFLLLVFSAPFLFKRLSLKSFDKRLLILLCFTYPFFYPLFLFHGGMGANFRYFLNLLPWGAMITVLWLREFGPVRDMVERFVLVAAVYALVLSLTSDRQLLAQVLIVWFPMLIVAALLVTFLITLKINSRQFARNMSIIVVVAIALSFSIVFFQDIPTMLKVRSRNYSKSELIEKYVPKNSFLFVFWGHKDSLALAKAEKNLIIADYHVDNGRDFFTLLEKNLEEGRPVYLYGESTHPELLEMLEREYAVRNVSKDIIPIYRINRRHHYLLESEDVEFRP